MTIGQRSKVKGQSKHALVLVAVLACAEYSQPAQVEPPAVRPDGIVAYLIASPSTAPNEYVVRAVSKRGVAVEDPASFLATLRLSPRGVVYVSDLSDQGALRVISASDTALRIAGASPEGLASGELFAVRLRAARAADLNALHLEIGELNDRSGISLRPTLVVLPHVAWVR